MRILVLNTDYLSFLSRMYIDNPGLADAGYEDQLRVRNESLFGVADAYSRNFRKHGHEAWEIHINNPWLQAAWAREHGIGALPPPDPSDLRRLAPNEARRLGSFLKSSLKPFARSLGWKGGSRSTLSAEERRIFRAQVEHYRPDVILNQDMGYVRDDVLGEFKDRGIIIIGQIAAALPIGQSYSSYNLVVSSLPNFVEWFRARGVRAELNRLAFNPRILKELGPPPERDVDVSFVGSLSPDHGDRIQLLETLARHTPLQLWGNGIARLPKSSPLWDCYRGEAWGRDMYQTLRRSRITINHHIDLSEDYANNMRLYEATGLGAAMLVDQKKNLQEIFEPGVEVMAYESPEHCLESIALLLNNERLRSEIASNGQSRTLTEHNYYNRTGELVALAQDILQDRHQ